MVLSSLRREVFGDQEKDASTAASSVSARRATPWTNGASPKGGTRRASHPARPPAGLPRGSGATVGAPAQRRGRDAEEPAEAPREVRMVGEAGVGGDLGQCRVLLPEAVQGAMDPQLGPVLHQGLARPAVEQPAEVVR